MVHSELVRSHLKMHVPECVICVPYIRSVCDNDDVDYIISSPFKNILHFRVLSHALFPPFQKETKT